MYELLQDISQRPEPFSRCTAKELWTRPHLAQQMFGGLAGEPLQNDGSFIGVIAGLMQ